MIQEKYKTSSIVNESKENITPEQFVRAEKFVPLFNDTIKKLENELDPIKTNNGHYEAIVNVNSDHLLKLGNYIMEKRDLVFDNFYREILNTDQKQEALRILLNILENQKDGLSPQVREFVAAAIANAGETGVIALTGIDVTELVVLAETFEKVIITPFDVTAQDCKYTLSNDISKLREGLLARNHIDIVPTKMSELVPIKGLTIDPQAMVEISKTAPELKQIQAVGLFTGIKQIFGGLGIISQIGIVALVGGGAVFVVKSGLAMHTELITSQTNLKMITDIVEQAGTTNQESQSLIKEIVKNIQAHQSKPSIATQGVDLMKQSKTELTSLAALKIVLKFAKEVLKIIKK
jgi:hypothetical protein